ncbi:hypothetical protein [Mycolicibacterium hodleri]|uniref:hypothetical protein n=1 Tax=Mycolicibacterium hodleri TaxID=49897 RepID=UPI001877E603|nr:hypothetical protein [Mycolicibacterium hodleri]
MAREVGIDLVGLSLMRHPDAGPEIPATDGIVVNFGAPAEHAFTGTVDALYGILPRRPG